MTIAYINPGTGPVPRSTKANAVRAIKQFVKDVGADKFTACRSKPWEGRYAFNVYKGKRKIVVDMPGLPLKKVRYLGKPQNIWDFPRLYVDCSSWVWLFAVDIAKDRFNPSQDDD